MSGNPRPLPTNVLQREKAPTNLPKKDKAASLAELRDKVEAMPPSKLEEAHRARDLRDVQRALIRGTPPFNGGLPIDREKQGPPKKAMRME